MAFSQQRDNDFTIHMSSKTVTLSQTLVNNYFKALTIWNSSQGYLKNEFTKKWIWLTLGVLLL